MGKGSLVASHGLSPSLHDAGVRHLELASAGFAATSPAIASFHYPQPPAIVPIPLPSVRSPFICCFPLNLKPNGPHPVKQTSS